MRLQPGVAGRDLSVQRTQGLQADAAGAQVLDARGYMLLVEVLNVPMRHW